MNTEPTRTLEAVDPTTTYYPLEYQPECWAMKKDSIYAARTALKVGLENTQELLADHDVKLGRTTRSNRYTAVRLEGEIREIKAAIEKLKEPDGTFYPFQNNTGRMERELAAQDSDNSNDTNG